MSELEVIGALALGLLGFIALMTLILGVALAWVAHEADEHDLKLARERVREQEELEAAWNLPPRQRVRRVR